MEHWLNMAGFAKVSREKVDFQILLSCNVETNGRKAMQQSTTWWTPLPLNHSRSVQQFGWRQLVESCVCSGDPWHPSSFWQDRVNKIRSRLNSPEQKMQGHELAFKVLELVQLLEKQGKRMEVPSLEERDTCKQSCWKVILLAFACQVPLALQQEGVGRGAEQAGKFFCPWIEEADLEGCQGLMGGLPQGFFPPLLGLLPLFSFATQTGAGWQGKAGWKGSDSLNNIWRLSLLCPPPDTVPAKQV